MDAQKRALIEQFRDAMCAALPGHAVPLPAGLAIEDTGIRWTKGGLSFGHPDANKWRIIFVETDPSTGFERVVRTVPSFPPDSIPGALAAAKARMAAPSA